MKNLLPYLFAITLLGSFSGLLMSMGSYIIPSIGMMSLFWACMLLPMLINNKS